MLGQELSGRDLILIGGGLFLLAKATLEIHEALEGEDSHEVAKGSASFRSVLFQIVLLDVDASASDASPASPVIRD